MVRDGGTFEREIHGAQRIRNRRPWRRRAEAWERTLLSLLKTKHELTTCREKGARDAPDYRRHRSPLHFVVDSPPHRRDRDPGYGCGCSRNRTRYTCPCPLSADGDQPRAYTQPIARPNGLLSRYPASSTPPQAAEFRCFFFFSLIVPLHIVLFRRISLEVVVAPLDGFWRIISAFCCTGRRGDFKRAVYFVWLEVISRRTPRLLFTRFSLDRVISSDFFRCYRVGFRELLHTWLIRRLVYDNVDDGCWWIYGQFKVAM